MKLAIKDANILIDLIEASLLDAWFSLEIETLTSNLVIDEIDDEGQLETLHTYADSGLLNIIDLNGKQIISTQDLMEAGPEEVSLEDCSALLLAIEIEADLMTGDRPLRLYAESLNVSVHGTLWILDQLVEHEMLTKSIALSKLKLLLKKDRRLPLKECEDRFRKWTAEK